jgi:transposase InsO family protein
MARAGIQDRLRAVLLYIEGVRESREIAAVSGISVRTLRRWVRAYRRGGLARLEPRRPGPSAGTGATAKRIEKRVLTLKQKHPSWGARRIKNQYGLACHWTTVHRIIKRHGMLVRIKPKPQPSKRFQRYHVDSMWQGDTFEFRIASVGKVYMTGFTDDRSRFRIRSGAYLHKSAKESIDALKRALRKGRTPRELYLDNGKQFIAKEFKREARSHGIRLIFGRPYHPRGRGKIENYHKVLWKDLISQVHFDSLAHFKSELRKFDRRYNHWRKQEPLGWNTPASIYNDKRYFNRQQPKTQR